ncbi:VC0807 family protein [Aureibacillus halotolerans]|uniref:Intracellular septation protein A n=1 Tax=Aureibacillus halotolerans TaxID=1508390 RepID=A0A4R6U3Z6_9BACI|nr:VC0807 family protein [Aureibacillus halotolerans]TDQ40791.1 hypothetical protein EV213_105137 [Aureibacillus halotolerans]
MKKYLALFDIVFYVVLPLVIWHGGRDLIGDYYAMLLSSVPGILYSVYRFIKVKKLNTLGIFLLGSLVIGSVIDVLSGSALQLLWNQVYYNFFLAGLFLLTILIKKPLSLYFGLDVIELQGVPREPLRKVFFKRKFYIVFVLLTAAFILRYIIGNLFQIHFINEYGVDAFDELIVVKQILGWVTSGAMVLGFLYIGKLIKEDTDARNVFQESHLMKNKESEPEQ